MDPRAVLAMFDEQIRRQPTAEAPGERVERDGAVVWVVAGEGGHNVVTWSQLDEATADAAIAATIERFAVLGVAEWEWKHYSHDRPADLPRRLLAAGLTPEPAEALMVAEIADLALDVPPPEGVELRPVTDEHGVDALARVHEEVFDEITPRWAVICSPGSHESRQRWSPWPPWSPWPVTPPSAPDEWSFTGAPSSPACGAAARFPPGEGAASSARSSPTAPRWPPPGASATYRSTPPRKADRFCTASASSSSPPPPRSSHRPPPPNNQQRPSAAKPTRRCRDPTRRARSSAHSRALR
jgi:hypothetical protein